MWKVAFYEFSVFPGVFPLVSGSLEAAAIADPILKARFLFQKQCIPVADPTITTKVGDTDADIFAFSCYVWNMGLVRRLVRVLRREKPGAYIILGGPQVMHRASLYLSPSIENEIVCNGEGERIFPNILRQIDSGSSNFRLVPGVSFYHEGQLVTTCPEERIRDLNEIPSPYLMGVMDPETAGYGVLETNRGCPFRCSYCYWGAATNAKVTKYSTDRIMEEITWFGENRVQYLFIADANFGMLQRDLDIAKHIALVNKRTGFPLSVYFSSSKNTPEKVAQVAAVLADAGLVTTLPISLQTMNENALRNVQRDNIKPESYLTLQRFLNERNLSSFIELIWPLPGETLKSFIMGLDGLCAMGADCFTIYPLLLIGNVEMEKQQDDLGLVSVPDPDPNSEARIVIETRDVSNAEYLEGIRISFHLTGLYSVRGLRFVASYLNHEKNISYSTLLTRFNEFYHTCAHHPYYDYIEGSITDTSFYTFSAMGGLAHNILHEFRSDYDALLASFLRAMGWFCSEEVALMFDMDILNRPCIYSNTRLTELNNLQVLEAQSSAHMKRNVFVPPRWRSRVAELLHIQTYSQVLSVAYRRSAHHPYMTGKSLAANHSYCQDRLHSVRSLLPKWSSSHSSAATDYHEQVPAKVE